MILSKSWLQKGKFIQVFTSFLIDKDNSLINDISALE